SIQMTRLNGKLSSTTFALIMARCLLLSLAMLTVLSGCFQPTASAQLFTGTYLRQIGTPTSVSPHPVELGYINLGIGILHLEIPLGSFPQRGSTAPLTFKLIYDSRIWQHFGPSSVWDFQNVKNIKGQ